MQTTRRLILCNSHSGQIHLIIGLFHFAYSTQNIYCHSTFIYMKTIRPEFIHWFNSQLFTPNRSDYPWLDIDHNQCQEQITWVFVQYTQIRNGIIQSESCRFDLILRTLKNNTSCSSYTVTMKAGTFGLTTAWSGRIDLIMFKNRNGTIVSPSMFPVPWHKYRFSSARCWDHVIPYLSEH